MQTDKQEMWRELMRPVSFGSGAFAELLYMAYKQITGIKKIKGLNGGLVSHEPDKMTCGWKYYFRDLKVDCEACRFPRSFDIFFARFWLALLLKSIKALSLGEIFLLERLVLRIDFDVLDEPLTHILQRATAPLVVIQCRRMGVSLSCFSTII